VTEVSTTLDYARSLDSADELAPFRYEFNIPADKAGRRVIYFCGNSLGLQPQPAVEMVHEVLADWGRFGVEAHFDAERPWLDYHRLATSGFAMLVGAEEHEVVAMNSLTVNLHLLMAGFYRPDQKRRKIIIESTAFPSDYFAVASQIRLHGNDPDECLVEWQPRDDELFHTEDLSALLEQNAGEIALMLLPGVQYYTGQVFDMAEHCRMARDAGCAIGLDLAHAVGNVPLELHDWAPDFAAWCTYKYLNSGPGAIGGAFVHSRHLDSEAPSQLKGWWGHEESTRFRMAREYRAADGIDRWQLSNPSILSLAPLVGSLQLFESAGMDALNEKSVQQANYLTALLQQQFAGQIDTLTPTDARGCQQSLVIADSTIDAKAVFKELEAMNVIGDWREPNVIRIAPVPMYNSFEDIHEFSVRLRVAIDANEKK